MREQRQRVDCAWEACLRRREDTQAALTAPCVVCSGNFLLLGERFKHTSGLKVNLVKWRGRAWKPLKWGM